MKYQIKRFSSSSSASAVLAEVKWRNTSYNKAYGLRQIAEKRQPRLRMSKTLGESRYLYLR